MIFWRPEYKLCKTAASQGSVWEWIFIYSLPRMLPVAKPVVNSLACFAGLIAIGSNRERNREICTFRRQICGSCDRYFCAACLGAFTVAPWQLARHQKCPEETKGSLRWWQWNGAFFGVASSLRSWKAFVGSLRIDEHIAVIGSPTKSICAKINSL